MGMSDAMTNKTMDIDTLRRASDAFFANCKAPVTTNLIKNVIDRSSQPNATAARIASHANATRVLVHSRLLPLLDEFLVHKRTHGTTREQDLYVGMSSADLVRRLIRNRPLCFYNHSDTTMLRDGSRPHGRDWGLVGADKEGKIDIRSYLTYDEMQESLKVEGKLNTANETGDFISLINYANPESKEQLNAATDSIYKVNLTNDDFQVGALLGVSSPTSFINAGDRRNEGTIAQAGTFEPEGVYVGLVGARFQKDNKMECQHIIVSEKFSRPEFGYGAEGATRNPSAASQLRPFAKLYYCQPPCPNSSSSHQQHHQQQKQQRNHQQRNRQHHPQHHQPYFPSYDEALADAAASQKNFHPLQPGSFINVSAYKARIRISIECLLVEADERAHESGTNAHVYVVGLGLGVWEICEKQAEWFVDVVADVLQSIVISHVSDVEFGWFPPHVSKCAEASNGEPVQGAGGNRITIHFTQRSPADPLPPSDSPKLLVASYAWDGNAFPGNEYWKGFLSSSGDPAAACCSMIGELQNAWINEEFPNRQFLVQTIKSEAAMGA